MAAAVEGSSSAPDFNSEEIAKLMGRGKRHYVCNEITQAVKCFEEACEALGKHYGEMANECGDAYLCYGKALLDLVRMESNAIGTAFQEAPEEEDGSDVDIEEALNTEAPKIKEMTAQEKEEVLKNVIDAMTVEKEKQTEGAEELATTKEEKSSQENEKSVEKSSQENEKSVEKLTQQNEKSVEKSSQENEKSVEKPQESSKDEQSEQTSTADVVKTIDKEDEDKKEKGVEENDDDDKEARDDDENGDDENGDDENGDDEKGDDDASGEGDTGGESETVEEKAETEEVSNIQLAWEILELARIIFESQEGKDACLHLAQCHLKLGEIKMEQEQFDDAITDLMKCLELQKKHLDSGDRLLAETLYNIGLCHNFQLKFDKAKEAFNDALNVIKLRMDSLEKRVAESESKSKGKGKAEADDPAVIDRKELEELKELYPEIKAKVDDANEMMLNSGSSVEKELKGQTTNGFGVSSSDDKPATLIAVKKVPKEPAHDISHLVKKVNKRKPEEETKESSENGAQPTKKLRQENDEDVPPDTTENKALNGTDTKEKDTATAVET